MLWTEIIDPATLTEYARNSMADYERRRGTLARWLPNRFSPDVVVRFLKGQTGLVDIAKFRAYDAEPAIGERKPAKRVTLELPALGQNVPVSEYEQLRARGASPTEEQALAAILNTVDAVVQATADAMEHLRGVVLVTGKATVDQGDEFQLDDDFGRSVGHTVTAGTLWSAGTNVSRLEYLETITDVYVAANGEMPGSVVCSNRVFRSLAQGDEFQTQLINGAARPATEQQVQDTVSGAGLPPIIRFDRRVSIDGAMTRVVPDDRLMLLPAAVEPDDSAGTDLGATWWGRTLTSTEAEWGIEDSEQPGIVTGVYRNPKPPMGLEVIADAIGMPVLANADRSLVAKVL